MCFPAKNGAKNGKHKFSRKKWKHVFSLQKRKNLFSHQKRKHVLSRKKRKTHFSLNSQNQISPKTEKLYFPPKLFYILDN